jgi:hypothetical protein
LAKTQKNDLINQSINQSIDPLINQSINPLINQSVNQEIDQSTVGQIFRRWLPERVRLLPNFNELDLYCPEFFGRWKIKDI